HGNETVFGPGGDHVVVFSVGLRVPGKAEASQYPGPFRHRHSRLRYAATVSPRISAIVSRRVFYRGVRHLAAHPFLEAVSTRSLYAAKISQRSPSLGGCRNRSNGCSARDFGRFVDRVGRIAGLAFPKPRAGGSGRECVHGSLGGNGHFRRGGFV